MDEYRAAHQDIRPIKIGLLNLMPLKEDTELQILRSLSNTPLQAVSYTHLDVYKRQKADWLYELPQWNAIFDEEKKKQLYREQKQSGTIRKGRKIGRNEPCPCGSGKKYKMCCGRNA